MQKYAQDSVIGEIGLLIDELNSNFAKQASAPKTPVKAAADDGSGSGGYKTDPGSIGGPSSHPTAKADGGNHPASYGSHGQETSSDIKKLIPNAVDEGSPKGGEGGDYGHVNIGVAAKPTGEDPSAEDAYKGNKDDPGTSTPVRADKGEKYSSATFPQLYKMACDQINEILTDIAATHVVQNPGTPTSKQASAAVNQAAAAGYELAELVTSETADNVKVAMAEELVATMIKTAYADADLVGELLYKLQERQTKLAAEGMPSEGMMPPGMGGGMPPGAEGGMPPGAEGGMPQANSAAMPEEMGRSPAPEGPEGAAGAEGGEVTDEAINEMANALIEAKIPVDKLIAALQGAEAQAGGAGGGAAGGMGGVGELEGGGPEKVGSAKMSRDDARFLLKVANDVSTFKDSGKFRRNPTNQLASKQAKAQREQYVDYLNYVREVLSIR